MVLLKTPALFRRGMARRHFWSSQNKAEPLQITSLFILHAANVYKRRADVESRL